MEKMKSELKRIKPSELLTEDSKVLEPQESESEDSEDTLENEDSDTGWLCHPSLLLIHFQFEIFK